MAGLKNEIGASGFDLLLFASERPGNGYGRHSYLKRARHHNVDGVVVMGLDPEEPEVARLARSEMPTVAVDAELVGPGTTYVISDNVRGGRLAVDHLHALGHRRIATITGLVETRPAADRLRGYRDALREHGLAYRDELVAYGDFYTDSGRRGMERLLALEEPPTAVVAASDMMALGAIRAAADAGLSVPGDVSVVGFDDLEFSKYVTPKLTTVTQDIGRKGATAVAMLVAAIEQRTRSRRPITLDVTLTVRDSTAPPKKHRR
jgi:LacI family transcriptional regulator